MIPARSATAGKPARISMTWGPRVLPLGPVRQRLQALQEAGRRATSPLQPRATRISHGRPRDRADLQAYLRHLPRGGRRPTVRRPIMVKRFRGRCLPLAPGTRPWGSRVRAFGDQLKHAREARGSSLDDLAEATRVARHHLVALEKGDLGALPAGPFAKGYIEACARALEVDAGPILEAYRAEAQKQGLGTPEAQDRMLDELTQIVEQRSAGTGEPGPGGGGRKGLLIGACVVIAFAIGGWLVLRGRTPEQPTSARSAPGPLSPATEASDSPPRSGSKAPDEAVPAGEPDRGRAAAPPRATPTRKPPRPNPNITIPDFGVGTRVEHHNLIGAADEFPERTEVVFWTRVEGGRPGDVVYHVWLLEGRGVARIPLAIGGSPWRTFSRRLLPQGTSGPWTAEARGVDGRLLARQEFRCVPLER